MVLLFYFLFNYPVNTFQRMKEQRNQYKNYILFKLNSFFLNYLKLIDKTKRIFFVKFNVFKQNFNLKRNFLISIFFFQIIAKLFYLNFF